MAGGMKGHGIKEREMAPESWCIKMGWKNMEFGSMIRESKLQKKMLRDISTGLLLNQKIMRK